jgi:transaldolase
MTSQGLLLGSWGPNVFVKIPITTTAGESCVPVVREVLDEGVDVNVSAMLADDQVRGLMSALTPDDRVIVSVFAGRIANAGVDPVRVMTRYVTWLSDFPGAELLWASPREVLNIVQAADCGCDIITVTPDLLRKFDLDGLAEVLRTHQQVVVMEEQGSQEFLNKAAGVDRSGIMKSVIDHLRVYR